MCGVLHFLQNFGRIFNHTLTISLNYFFYQVGADNIEIKQPFIADDEEIYVMVADDNNNESDEEEDEDLFDSICAICDNGGDLLWQVQSSI